MRVVYHITLAVYAALILFIARPPFITDLGVVYRLIFDIGCALLLWLESKPVSSQKRFFDELINGPASRRFRVQIRREDEGTKMCYVGLLAEFAPKHSYWGHPLKAGHLLVCLFRFAKNLYFTCHRFFAKRKRQKKGWPHCPALSGWDSDGIKGEVWRVKGELL